MDRRIVGARQRLENLEDRARTEPISSDDELKAQIAQLLCVLTSGFIEESIRIILSEVAERQSSPIIASFVSSRLGEFQNPKFEKILVLLGSFSPDWRDHFEGTPTDEMKAAIAVS